MGDNESYWAIQDLIDYLGIQQKPTVSFNANVVYDSSIMNTINDNTEVDITFESNRYQVRLNIDNQSEILNSETHHLDFSTDYQKFRYLDGENYLEITGQSRKCGQYTIRIYPM